MWQERKGYFQETQERHLSWRRLEEGEIASSQGNASLRRRELQARDLMGTTATEDTGSEAGADV